MRWVRLVGLGVLALASAACDREKPMVVEPPPPLSAAPAPASSKPALDAGKAHKELSAAERKAYRAYLAALERGRKATRVGDTPAALDGFDAALRERPGDARALSERGFAKLKGDDLNGAEADLKRAAQLASDKQLLASTWFNLGLVAERRNEGEKARAAFARSQKLNPTKSAAAKLSGQSACPVRVNRTPQSLKTFSGWGSLAKALSDAHQSQHGVAVYDALEPGGKATSLIPAITWPPGSSGPSGEGGSGPFVLRLKAQEWGGVYAEHVVARKQDQSFVLVPDTASGMMGRCTDGGETTVRGGSPLWISMESSSAAVKYMCESPDGGVAPCPEDQDSDAKPIQSYCESESWSRRDLFVDVEKASIVLEVEQTGRIGSGARDQQAGVERKGNKVQIRQSACDQSIPLP